MSPEQTGARLRLAAALDHLSVTFAGMTAHPDEHNCECHWGGPEELAQLKTPDTALDPDLLRRSWQATDWTDHGAVLRRILPQFARALAGGLDDAWPADVGRSFSLGRWQEWPDAQAAAVREFLHAWWASTLSEPHPVVPVHDVLTTVIEASATAGPWLAAWEALTGPPADGHLAGLVAAWEWELLGDQLPWTAWDDEDEIRATLTAWLVRYAPARLRAHGAPAELIDRIRLLGLAADRWDDPRWGRLPDGPARPQASSAPVLPGE
ncbi:hypothetical protein [Streptomyces sp. A0958]|uniref:hypothetical protein n=1 Tax=Streptomyces sp. A0958 TaxID=2563101 RepID=UPI001F0D10F4|nr:hypothetical protein [Streptomyces sp. A0958]